MSFENDLNIYFNSFSKKDKDIYNDFRKGNLILKKETEEEDKEFLFFFYKKELYNLENFCGDYSVDKIDNNNSMKLFINRDNNKNWYRDINIENVLNDNKNKEIYIFKDLLFLYIDDENIYKNNKKDNLENLLYYIIMYYYK